MAKRTTYYAVVKSGATIYEGMGRKEASDYAKKHGGAVVVKKAVMYGQKPNGARLNGSYVSQTAG